MADDNLNPQTKLEMETGKKRLEELAGAPDAAAAADVAGKHAAEAKKASEVPVETIDVGHKTAKDADAHDVENMKVDTTDVDLQAAEDDPNAFGRTPEEQRKENAEVAEENRKAAEKKVKDLATNARAKAADPLKRRFTSRDE